MRGTGILGPRHDAVARRRRRLQEVRVARRTPSTRATRRPGTGARGPRAALRKAHQRRRQHKGDGSGGEAQRLRLGKTELRAAERRGRG
jgi:hypothetical protein